MHKNDQQFIKTHPYLHLILVMFVVSLIGITIEYVINQDFIGSGLFTSLILLLIEMLRIRKKETHHKLDKHK